MSMWAHMSWRVWSVEDSLEVGFLLPPCGGSQRLNSASRSSMLCIETILMIPEIFFDNIFCLKFFCDDI